MTYTEELKKVMNQTVFVYRNCLIEKLIGGFKVFGTVVKNQEELDKIIGLAAESIGKSISVGSQEL